MSTPKSAGIKSIAIEIYPESGNIYDSISKAIQCGLSGWCSPLHTPDGKKSHYHVEFVIFSPKSHGYKFDTWKTYVDFVGAANGVFQQCFPHDYAAYLIHKRNPEKQQFPDYHVIQFENNISIESNLGNVISFGATPDYNSYIEITDDRIILSKAKMSKTLVDVYKHIRSNNIRSYSYLLDWVIDNKLDWFDVVNSNCRQIISYMSSLVYTDKLLAIESSSDSFSDNQERSVMSKHLGYITLR